VRKDRTPSHALARGARYAALALGATLAPAAVPAAGAQPVAVAASHHCSVPHYPGSGYFTSLVVSGTSCSTGRTVTLDYYKCRIHQGAKGTCHSKVIGFTCSEKRVSVPTEIDARVTCRRGSATVVHTYQQNL